MNKPPDERVTDRTAAPLALLVIGISINTLGVVLVALRGVGWIGFLLMLVGIAMLLYSVVRLAAEARRKQVGSDGGG